MVDNPRPVKKPKDGMFEITLFITLKVPKQNLFFTKKNGVYVEENGSLSPENPLNETLKTANINVAHLKNNKLVVGTSRGVYVLILIRILTLILTEIMC
jgi:hypothetical protein